VGAGSVQAVQAWEGAPPRFDGHEAGVATRHRTTAPRPEALGPPLVAAPEPPPVLPAAPRAAVRRAPQPAAEVETVTIEVPDLPEPPPHEPLSFDDLYPRPAPVTGDTSGHLAPCFDQLQGIKGLSPCPDSTPR